MPLIYVVNKLPRLFGDRPEVYTACIIWMQRVSAQVIKGTERIDACCG